MRTQFSLLTTTKMSSDQAVGPRLEAEHHTAVCTASMFDILEAAMLFYTSTQKYSEHLR